MASKMDVIFKEYYLYVRTSSEQADIFRIGPEKSVEQHTKSPWESTWSSPRIQDGDQNGRHLSKNINSILETPNTKLKFSE